MSESLIKYGTSFQSKIITSLIVNNKFTKQIIDILEISYFDSDSNKFLIKSIKDYFLEYKNTPTMEALKVLIDDIENDVLKTTIVDSLRNAWNHRESPDLDFVQEKTLEFCKNQIIKNAIMESVELLDTQNYDGIKLVIDDAMKAGVERDIGHEYLTGFEERMSEQVRECLPTQWDSVNDLMDGGLAGGELGVVVAPAGIGKSWVLSAMGAYAISQGLNIVHYTLELNEAYVGLRYDSVITGIANQNLKHYQEDIKEQLSKLDGELIIKHYPTKSVSVMGLRSHVEKCIMQGKKPDVIIVDYADLLRGHGQEKRHELEGIYEDLRGMAGEYEIPVWTASQANRSALEEDIIDASKISESYGKVMVADFVLSLSRKVQDKLAGTGRWHVIKNRFGPDGITYPAKVNTNTGKMDIYESSSVGGKEQQQKIDNRDNLMKKMLANKYEDMMND